MAVPLQNSSGFDESSVRYTRGLKVAAAGARAADGKRHPAAVREVSLQRVYMRNEMFKEPLTSEELESCLQSHTPRRWSLSRAAQDNCISVVCGSSLYGPADACR